MTHRIGFVLVPLVAAVTTWAPSEARACGGFFCNNIDPVVQAAERILFRVNDDCTITTIVEIQYEGEASDFAWVLPIPEPIPVESIGTAPAGLFDELEALTAPVFRRPSSADEGGGAASSSSEASGCAGPGFLGGGGEWSPPPPDTSGVEVVGEAVVGPYAIEIITAEQGDNLSNWLALNGYQIPLSAAVPMDHYIQGGAAFVGIKLQPDAPSGPIDALKMTYPGKIPSIPLLLTAIAAAPEMDVIAYVVAPSRYSPGNYDDLPFDYQSVSWVGDDETDYLDVLPMAIDEGDGRAWNTEFAGPTESLLGLDPGPAAEHYLRSGAYINRFHTFISAHEMTADPYWEIDVTAPEVSNFHVLYEDGQEPEGGEPGNDGSDGGTGTGLLLAPFVLLALRRRWRRRRR